MRVDEVSLLSISKSRWMRKYDIGNSRVIEVELKEDEAPKNDAIKLPGNGCNLELTRLFVEPAQQAWWTVGCEAFGPSLGLVEQNFRMII